MPDYDFTNLSPYEFEALARDILQKKLKIHLESFTQGKDGGIDFRYISTINKATIIQVKHVKNSTTLLSVLSKEKEKVIKLTPARYILVISIGITPDQKEKLFNLFAPHIKSRDDIITRDDLNNFLGQYPEVEDAHYKLWLSSTAVFNRMLHSKIVNQSIFEIEEIKDKAKFYVQNNSFVDALDIINNYHYVIISGIPGIGKTTLARAVVLWLLGRKFDEFIYLSDSIDEAYEQFDVNKKQLYYFDDFLGKNFFSAKEIQNVDEKIVKFIERIKKSNNKAIIFTTREYILKQAQDSFEVFNTKNISIAKCTINLLTYTRLIRAQIIYNHMYFSDVPKAYLKNLVTKSNYLHLINHPNYNPRIIETILHRKIWNDCKAGDFTTKIKGYFDNPESIWMLTFENNLSKLSQYTLMVLATLCNPVKLSDLKAALNEFFSVSQLDKQILLDDINFQKNIRQLEDTFLKTYEYNGEIVVEYQNPSILDFLVNYLRSKKDIINQLIDAVMFVEQFYTIFTGLISEEKGLVNRKIYIGNDTTNRVIKRLKKLNRMESCKVMIINSIKSETTALNQTVSFQYRFLSALLDEFKHSNNSLAELLYKRFLDQVLKIPTTLSEQLAYVRLLTIYKQKQEIEENIYEILNGFIKKFQGIKSVKIFNQLNFLFHNQYKEIIKSTLFFEAINRAVHFEILQEKDGNLPSLIDNIKWVEKNYQISMWFQIREVEEIIESYYSELGAIRLFYNLGQRYYKSQEQLSYEKELYKIEEIFYSLVE